MWSKRIAAAAALTALSAAGGLAVTGAGAIAGGKGEPIYGDVNGDGYRDRVYLGTIQPDSCSVVVEYGRPMGVLLPPAAYTYLRPGGVGLDIPCPDLGVAVDLAADGIDDLVIGWSGGPPGTLDYTLRVLGSNFQPIFGLREAIHKPKFMGTADFNGDGRPDVYSVSDEDQGFESYYALGNGTLTPGPLKWCAAKLDYILRDFNRDGADGAVFAYTNACTDHSNGVVRVSQDGVVQMLQHDPTATRTWKINVVYANDDSWADIRTTEHGTGEVTNFIQVPGGIGFAHFERSPTAVQDKVVVPAGKATSIPVLDNDFATTATKLTIVTPPEHGTVRLTSKRTVVYTPHGTGLTGDRFVYRLTGDGKTSTAPVNIRFSH